MLGSYTIFPKFNNTLNIKVMEGTLNLQCSTTGGEVDHFTEKWKADHTHWPLKKYSN